MLWGAALCGAALCGTGALAPSALWAKEPKKSEDGKVPEKPPVNNPVLVVEAVTAQVAGDPPGTVIMTFSVDCGTLENAQQVDNLMPRVYNAVIMELNREPLGNKGRITDRDLDGLKSRLKVRINQALKGPAIEGVYIRSLQEVPRRNPPSQARS